MIDITPVTRIEHQLDGIVNDSPMLPDPFTRIELMLEDIKNGVATALTPITRIEFYLAKISGADVAIPAPVTRIEMYLAAIAGEEIEVPEPITRVEYWLSEWVEQGGGTWATITGTTPLELINALAKPLKTLLQHGKVSVSGTDITCNNGTLKYGVLGKNLLDQSAYDSLTRLEYENGVFSGTQARPYNAGYYCRTLNGEDGIQTSWLSYDEENDRYVASIAVDLAAIDTFRFGVSGYNTNDYASFTPSDIFPESGTYYFSYRVIVPFPSEGGDFAFTDVQITATEDYEYEPYSEGFYTDGTPEEITVTAEGADPQTATAENLYAVGDIADTQDIITGEVIRRTEAVVSDGTTPTGRYVGTVGEGNIIVKALETGHTGDIVSFESDGRELNGLVARMQPIQDLHGQDAPYPAGGGKNKLYTGTPYRTIANDSASAITSEEELLAGIAAGQMLFKGIKADETNGVSYSVTNQVWAVIPNLPAGTYAFNYCKGIFQVDSTFETVTAISGTTIGSSVGEKYFTVPSGTDYIFIYVENYAQGSAQNPWTIDDVISTGQIELGQSCTSYAPYSNICPITGWTGCEVVQSGETLCYIQDFVQGSMGGTGSPTGSTIRLRSKRYTVEPNTKYTFKVPSGFYVFEVHEFTSAESFIKYTTVNSDTGTIETSATTGVIAWLIRKPNNAVITPSEVAYALCTPGETATATLLPITFPDSVGTVYGGTVDVVSGELVVDRAIIDLSTLSWLYASTYQLFRASITGMRLKGIICSSYKSSTSTRIESVNDKEIWNNSYAFDPINVVIKDTAYTDASTFKESLSGVTAVYYLATPTEIQLTPQEISTLAGENNVWSNTNGQTTVYVPADFIIEHATPQPLRTTEGDNTLTVTAEVDGIEFDVEYKAEAESGS